MIMAMQLGSVGPAMFSTAPPQIVHGMSGGGGDPGAGMLAELVRTILRELADSEEKQRAALKADEQEFRARGASGVGGLLDSQRAGLAAIRDPQRRATALGSMAHANRTRMLKGAGIPENAPYVTAVKNDETEAEYIQRIQQARAAHEANARRVRDKLRAETARDRAYKAATGKRGTGYVVTADTQRETDPLNPLAPPKQKTTYSTAAMVEQPNRRPVQRRDSYSSVDFPGHGSGGQMFRGGGYADVDAARQAAQQDVGAMGGGQPFSPAERTAVLNGPTAEEKLKETLMRALLGGAMPF